MLVSCWILELSTITNLSHSYKGGDLWQTVWEMHGATGTQSTCLAKLYTRGTTSPPSTAIRGRARTIADQYDAAGTEENPERRPVGFRDLAVREANIKTAHKEEERDRKQAARNKKRKLRRQL